jgi:hypothetical protein
VPTRWPHPLELCDLDADAFDDLPGKWQAAILKAEQNRPGLRVVPGDSHDSRGA